MHSNKKDNLDEWIYEIELFDRVDGKLTDQVFVTMRDVRPDTAKYFIENGIKISEDTVEDGDKDYSKGILVYFDDGDNEAISVSTKDLSCEDVMDKAVELLKERQAA